MTKIRWHKEARLEAEMAELFTNIEELPAGWKWARLGEVCKTTSGGTPSRKNLEYFTGDIPWVKSGELPDGTVTRVEERITELAIENSSAKLFPAGTLLIALYGATVGKLGILRENSATNQAVCAIFPSEPLHTKYLFWYLRFVRSNLVAQAVGGAQPNISQGILRELLVPIAPLDQQKRIVAEIEKQFSRLDEGIDNLKRVQANLKRYKAAVLKAAVEGRLVETEAEIARREGRDFETGEQLLQRILQERRCKWEETELAKMQARGKPPKNDKWKQKYKEPAAPDTTNLPQLSEGWVWASISQVANVASGNTPTGILTVVKQKGDLPWFKVGDMNHEDNQQTMRHSDSWLTDTEVKQLGLRIFPENTVLFPKRGGAIATNKKRRLAAYGCADLNVMGITPAASLASYFFVWFDGVDLAGLSDGSNVPQINHKDIEPLLIPIPPTIEQHRIVAEVDRRLSILRETEAQVEANLQRAERLRQSILAAAFSGRLVPCGRDAAEDDRKGDVGATMMSVS